MIDRLQLPSGMGNLIRSGRLTSSDAANLRDAIIGTRELQGSVAPAAQWAVDKANYDLWGDYSGELELPKVGCISAALIAIFGAEILSPSHPPPSPRLSPPRSRTIPPRTRSIDAGLGYPPPLR